MWNKVNQSIPNNKGFDEDAVLSFRDRLIIFYQVGDRREGCVGEAYVHDGEWYWWHTKSKIMAPNVKILAWTTYPLDLL